MTASWISSFAVAALFAVTSARAADPAPSSSGPFEIAPKMRSISSGAFPNLSANPFGRMTISEYEVRYRGKAVKVADDAAQISRFSNAVFLDGAPRPAVLASEAGTYLLSERNGQLAVEVLAPAKTDIASWQWLDGDNGQPAAPLNITVRDSTDEPRTLRGGRLLYVNRAAVLDVATLSHYPVVANAYETLQRIGDYNAGNEPVRALSPGRSQLVMVGNRYINGRYEYALVVTEYASGRVYSVPFDRTALRFDSVWDATPEWLAKSFAWTREASGAERVALRKDFTPPPWQGRFRGTPPRREYILHPAEPQAFDAFYGWLQRTYGAGPAPPLPGSSSLPNTRLVAAGGGTFYLYYSASEKTLYLSSAGPANADPAPNYRLIAEFGERFNAELAQGRYQELFGAYPD